MDTNVIYKKRFLSWTGPLGRRVLRFDGDYAAEGCGGGFAASKKGGARLAPQVGADCVGRLCRKGQRPFGPRVVVSPYGR